MRLGLIGLKGHQGVVLEGARQLGTVELVAVADDAPAALEAFRRSEPLAKTADTYADWRHLVEHALMDVCCVCDENALRTEQLLALLERDIHIVTEKPLATDLEDLARIKAALAQSKSRLTMLLTMRHEPKYVAVRELIHKGAIGQPSIATAQKSYQLHARPEWFKERKRLGGTIPYIGVHALDLVRWTTGLDFTHVAAFHGQIGKPQMRETESQASLLLRLSNGGSATARLDYLRPQTAPSHGDDRLRIAGDQGVIEVQASDPAVWLVTASSKPQRITPAATSNFFADFARALAEGRPARISAEDSVYLTEVCLYARDAADQQRLVELPAAK